jgi:hypothetical protein
MRNCCLNRERRAFKRAELAYELRNERYSDAYSKAYTGVSSEYKTFDEWKALGKWVKKGEKATKRNGINYFHRYQVK